MPVLSRSSRYSRAWRSIFTSGECGVELRRIAEIARGMHGEVAEYSALAGQASVASVGEVLPKDLSLDPILAEFDRRISDLDLRAAARSRFVSGHYADAVEAGVKALSECVRSRTGRVDDGDSLMSNVFSPNAPLLRINRGKSKSDESAQRGHMHLCLGVVGAWRNPRAHELIDDSPERTLMMLEAINELILVTKAATRTRRRGKP